MVRQRRMKGEGSITKLPSGKYRVRLEVSPSPLGKRQWLTAVVNTQKEATAKLQEFQQTKNTETTIEKLKTSYADYIDAYISFKTTEGLTKSSLYTLEKAVRKIGGFFGNIPVQKIDANLIQSVIEQWRQSGNKEVTVRIKFKTLCNYLEWLKTNKKVIAHNPTNDVKLLRKKIKPYLMKNTITEEEHKKLKTIMQEYWFSETPRVSLRSKFYAIYLLAYETGMREGELAGLRTKSINFETNTVTVENSLAYVGEGTFIDNPPKTAAGYRSIVVSKKTMDILKELYSEDKEFIFTNERDGRPYSPHSFLTYFKGFQEKAGLDNKFNFHAIRHTNASIMIAKGVPTPVITERLGHSSVAVTYSTYAHALRDSKERKEALVEA